MKTFSEIKENVNNNSNMEKISYTPYDEVGDEVPQEIKDMILEEDEYFFDSDDNKFKLRNVEFPFILADNVFDLSEANNDLIEIGVVRDKVVSFTGGNLYIQYSKDPNSNKSLILHGNIEEGYNIFLF
jgi:hypothetical protein